MRWALHALAFSGLVVSVAACVGDTATQNNGNDSGTAGEEGGACYPDDTCNKNKPWLKCLSKLCVNAGSDGGSDGGGGGDAAPDSTTDGGNDGGAVTCPNQAQATANTVRCINNQPCGQLCCFQNGTFTCDSSCSAGPTAKLGCDDLLDCPSQRCCLTATVAQLACPVVLSGYSGSSCKAACGSADVEICGLGDTCADSKTCVKTTIGGNEYGICVK